VKDIQLTAQNCRSHHHFTTHTSYPSIHLNLLYHSQYRSSRKIASTHCRLPPYYALRTLGCCIPAFDIIGHAVQSCHIVLCGAAIFLQNCPPLARNPSRRPSHGKIGEFRPRRRTRKSSGLSSPAPAENTPHPRLKTSYRPQTTDFTGFSSMFDLLCDENLLVGKLVRINVLQKRSIQI